MGALLSSSDTISPPILNVLPDYPFYYKGETVTLTCNTDSQYRRAYFSFFKNSQYIQTNNVYIHTINSFDYSDVGNYVCEFWAVTQSSTRSNEVTLFFSDPLPPPVISSLSVLTMGEPVTLICSPPKGMEGKRIQFYKEGNVPILSETDKNTYVITSNKEVPGRYSCTYSLEMKNKWRTSQSSEYILVNIAGKQTMKKGFIRYSKVIFALSLSAYTIIPKSPAPEMTSKTRPTETFSPTQSNKVTHSTKGTTAGTIVSELPAFDLKNKTPLNTINSWNIFIFMVAGGLILITTFVCIQHLVQIYIQRNGKLQIILFLFVFLKVPESDLHSVYTLRTVAEPFLCPPPLQEKETEHFYSEIELPIVKTPPPIVYFYSKANAIDPLHPVYQTNLATNERN
ncbi:hypothetical protein PRIEUP_LOCUS351 [Pristimantis euphronides]